MAPDVPTVMNATGSTRWRLKLCADLAKCVIKTASVGAATKFPCDFCNKVVKFEL
jgi:hypothetical protein